MSWGKRLMSLMVLGAVVAAVVAIVLTNRSSAQALPHTAATSSLRVRGNQLVFGPGTGQAVQLRGINRAGAEYECLKSTGGFFDSPHPDQPDSNAMVDEMTAWDINSVRLPLNEGCWLGIDSPAGSSGAVYRRAITAEVARLNAHHLFVILALQWNGAGHHESDRPLPMADATHSPAFWRSVATTFKGDGLVMFDLFNEPHSIDWGCWLNGCEIPASRFEPYSYRAAGMQSLVDAVRSTGNPAPLVISGPNWAQALNRIEAYTITDPDHDLVYAIHSNGGESSCAGACETAALTAALHHPILYTEIGELNCGDSYLKSQLPVLDRHGIGYLAWAWDEVSPGTGGWSCENGPALIDNYGGTPTRYGAGYRDFLQRLGEPVRP